MEISTACNLRCIHCEHTFWKEEPQFMRFETFKKIVEHFQTNRIDISGIGENMLNPDFEKILRYACEVKGNENVEFTTNLQLMNDKWLELFKELKPGIITISVDGGTKESFEKTKCGANWEHTIEWITKMLAEGLNVSVNYLVNNFNYNEMQTAVDMWSDIGIKNMQFFPLCPFLQCANQFLSYEEVKEAFSNLKHNGINLNLGGAKFLSFDPNSPFITVDGYIIPSAILTQTVDRDKLIEIWGKGNIPHRVDSVKELSRYSKEDEQITVNKMRIANDALMQEWKDKNPKTQKERDDYYKNTDWFIYDLMSWGRPRWLKKIEKYYNPNMKVLDYGGGCGDFCIGLGEILPDRGVMLGGQGANIDYLDIEEGHTWNFAKWRFKERDLSINMVSVPSKDKYDIILCFDVFEHLDNPEEKLNELANLQNKGDLLFMNVGFHDMRPMHIYHDDAKFRKELDKLYELVEDGRMEVWRRK